MEYAVFKSGGKQYKVKKGDVLEIDKIEGVEDKPFFFEEVLLYVSDGNFKLGKPNLAGFKIKAKILKQKKGDKIYVEKFKAKARYRRAMGFRPRLTEIVVEDLVSDKKTTKPSARSVRPKKS